jgi:hypothetical protein
MSSNTCASGFVSFLNNAMLGILDLWKTKNQIIFILFYPWVPETKLGDKVQKKQKV